MINKKEIELANQFLNEDETGERPYRTGRSEKEKYPTTNIKEWLNLAKQISNSGATGRIADVIRDYLKVRRLLFKLGSNTLSTFDNEIRHYIDHNKEEINNIIKGLS